MKVATRIGLEKSLSQGQSKAELSAFLLMLEALSWEDDMAYIDPLDRGFGEFFVYASCHWIDHFGGTGSTFEHLPSLVSIENVCQSGSIRLRN